MKHLDRFDLDGGGIVYLDVAAIEVTGATTWTVTTTSGAQFRVVAPPPDAPSPDRAANDVARVRRAMQGRPAERWTVQQLRSAAGFSGSRHARFTAALRTLHAQQVVLQDEGRWALVGE